ncbi:MAG: DNA polymerase III subunit beta [Archaeoglobaceae archaeon]
MKVVLSVAELKTKVSLVAEAVPSKKNLNPLLANYLFEAKNGQLLLCATDLEVGAKANVRYLELEGSDRFLIPADALEKIVKNLPADEVTLEKVKDTLVISCGKTTYRIPTASADEFPELAFAVEGITFEIDTSLLAEMVENTLFASAKDEMMRNFHGVFWDCDGKTLRLVATDGFRLALAEEPLENVSSFNFLLSLKSMKEINEVLSNTTSPAVVVRYDGRRVSLFCDDVETTFRVVDAGFPEYQRVIPSQFKVKLQLSNKELQKALKRISVISPDVVKFEISDTLKISTKAPDVGEALEEIEVQKEGEDLVVAFNPKYLLDGLKHVATEDVELAFAGKENPCKISPVGLEGFIYILMPVRLPEGA